MRPAGILLLGALIPALSTDPALAAPGALVTTLVDGIAGPGYFEEFWRGRDDRGGSVPSGVYFMRLAADGRASTRSVVYLKVSNAP